MKVRILGNIKHDGNLLEQYEVYDLDNDAAEQLIRDGVAQKVADDYKNTSTYTPKKRGDKPGELVDAVETPSENTVKGVEAKPADQIQGDDAGDVDPDPDAETGNDTAAETASDTGEKGGA